MGDTYSYAIVYSIRRDDGSPLVSDETLAAGAERDGLLPLRFRNYGTQVRTSPPGSMTPTPPTTPSSSWR